jgi:GAF domain-containing protein
VRPFSDKQIVLLQNFAAQAVIALENARLITETREALESQTATAEVLGVINSNPGDLAPVFDTMLERAIRLCGADHGHVFTYDGELFRGVAARGEPRFIEGLLARPPFPPSRGITHLRLVQGAHFVHVADIHEDEVYRAEEPSIQARIDSSGIRSLVTVSLRKDDVLLGAISVYRQEVRPFTDKQIALLQNFAAQAVIAMENARLITETREALEQQTATAEVLQVINSSPGDLTPVFEAILEKAHTLCGAAHGALLIRDGQEFRAVTVRGEQHFVEAVRRLGPLEAPEGSGVARLMAGERIVHNADAAAGGYDNYPPAFVRAFDAVRIHTTLLIPLRKDDQLLGVITAFRQEVRPFTDKQIALLENFAAQAVIAMENARLLTETRETLEQQTATAEVLGVINSSPGDLAPVFEAILEKAMQLCGAAFGLLDTYDGERVLTVAHRGVPAALAEFRAKDPPIPHPGSSLAQAIETRNSIQVVDAMVREPYRSGNPHARALVELGGVRTLLSVPLCKEEAVLGLITVYRQEVRPFTDKQTALLENFAAQAVIAMENARLLTETREALEQQTAMAEVLQVINSSPGDVAPVFEAILAKAHTLCGATVGFLASYDGEFFHFVAAHGYPPEYEALIRTPFRPYPDMGQRLLDGERFIHATDVALTPSDGPIKRMAIEIVGIRTTLFVPLRRDGTLLGYISAQRREARPFSDREIALIENFAAQAVIAMENARLLGELRQRTDQIADLNRGLEARVAEQVEELGRVGRLKRFLAPQLAELIVSQGNEKILESHRREIVVVFCDLRGYTAFTETAEPEEVLDFLRDYHGALGPLVAQFEGTLDQFSGDGIMVFFNDPVPVPDPAERAVKMAMAMREAAQVLIAKWRRRGRELGFGAGIAQGYATLGQIGFAERSGYTAIGTVCNLAARLCAEAKDGQILLAQRLAVAVEEIAVLEEIGPLSLKGLTQPVVAYNVPLAATQPALRVIEGGPQSV